MIIFDIILDFQWIFLLFFIGLNLGYIILNIISIKGIYHCMEGEDIKKLPQVYSGLEPPITILVPAYNEELTIVDSVHSLLQLEYSEYEVLVINDGSKDKTLEVLIQEFSLVAFPEAYRIQLPTKPVKTVYCSTVYPNLRVIDKENGGKGDTLNAGINGSRYPLFCSIDADSILQRDSLQRVVQPFLDDPTTVASGGTVRIANGCKVSGGFLVKVGLPHNLLAIFQVVEYLRAFLFGRLGWSPLNALLVISGAFALFSKKAVVAAGGYRTDTVGEDMELVVRLHKKMRLAKRPYRVTFVPDPICWTEVPENLKTLKRQRVRWQRGLSEGLMMNLGLLFNRKGGTAGWLAFPFFLIFEWFGPLIEVTGYIFMITLFLSGLISTKAIFAFLTVAIGFGALLSGTALLLEEMSFHLYPKLKDIFKLSLAAIAENFGYRQLTSVFRLMGLLSWFFGRIFKDKSGWGEMKRIASWKRRN